MPGKNRDVDKAAYNYSLFYRTYFTIKEREKSMGFILFLVLPKIQMTYCYREENIGQKTKYVYYFV